eukprot:gene13862-19785_t
MPDLDPIILQKHDEDWPSLAGWMISRELAHHQTGTQGPLNPNKKHEDLKHWKMVKQHLAGTPGSLQRYRQSLEQLVASSDYGNPEEWPTQDTPGPTAPQGEAALFVADGPSCDCMDEGEERFIPARNTDRALATCAILSLLLRTSLTILLMLLCTATFSSFTSFNPWHALKAAALSANLMVPHPRQRTESLVVFNQTDDGATPTSANASTTFASVDPTSIVKDSAPHEASVDASLLSGVPVLQRFDDSRGSLMLADPPNP